MVGIVAFTIKEYIKGLDTFGKILIIVVIIGIVLIGISYILSWVRNRDVRKLLDWFSGGRSLLSCCFISLNKTL